MNLRQNLLNDKIEKMKKQNLKPEYRSFTSMQGSVSPNLPRSPSSFTTRNNRFNRHSIDVGSLVRSNNPAKDCNNIKKNKSKEGVLDPTKPCQLKQIITEELTTFSNQNKPKRELQPSESWILTRKACLEVNEEQEKKNMKNRALNPKLNIKQAPSMKSPLSVVQETNKNNIEKTETISEKTKRLLRRKKSLNNLIQRVKPKTTASRDDIFERQLDVPSVMIRSSSDSCMKDDINKDINSLPRPLSATNIDTVQVQRSEFFIH